MATRPRVASYSPAIKEYFRSSFNISRDLVMTGGFIDPTSLNPEGDGSYTFNYTVDPAQSDPGALES